MGQFPPRTAADALVGLRFVCFEEPDQGVRRRRGRPPRGLKCAANLATEDACSLSAASGSQTHGYWPAQVTLSFQSMNEPIGLLRQAQTCSSKKAGMLNRFGASTN